MKTLKSRIEKLEQKMNPLEKHEAQLCDICGKPESAKARGGGKKHLAGDHDHNTGTWRGQLCQRCNTALGLFNDDIETLKNAIKYLKITPLQWNKINDERFKKKWLENIA